MGYADPPPSVFSRGGSLLPSIYADARYIAIDVVIVSQAGDRCELLQLDQIHLLNAKPYVWGRGGVGRSLPR